MTEPMSADHQAKNSHCRLWPCLPPCWASSSSTCGLREASVGGGSGPQLRGVGCFHGALMWQCGAAFCRAWNHRPATISLSDPAICGIQTPAHLMTTEQGQRGAEGSCSSSESEVCRGDLSLSFLSSSGWDSAQAEEGSSLYPAVVHLPPLQAAAVQLHHFHPRLGGKRGMRDEGPSWACWPGDFGFCL